MNKAKSKRLQNEKRHTKTGLHLLLKDASKVFKTGSNFLRYMYFQFSRYHPFVQLKSEMSHLQQKMSQTDQSDLQNLSWTLIPLLLRCEQVYRWEFRLLSKQLPVFP